MVVVVERASQLRSLISSVPLLLVVVYDTSVPTGRYVESLAWNIAAAVEPAMLVALVDAREAPEALEAISVEKPSLHPRLQLYLNGTKIWEQRGVFEDSSADSYAIRRGILQALRLRGLRPRDLGLRLTF